MIPLNATKNLLMKLSPFFACGVITAAMLPTTAIAHPHDPMPPVASEAPAGEVPAEGAHDAPAGEIAVEGAREAAAGEVPVKGAHEAAASGVPVEKAGEIPMKKMPAMQQWDPTPFRVERARLIRDIGPLSKVTDIEKLELRDGLAWLPDANEPYTGWAKKTWEIRHRHSDDPDDGWHTHNKFTDLAKFEAGVPTKYGNLDEQDNPIVLKIFADKDSQRKTWVADF